MSDDEKDKKDQKALAKAEAQDKKELQLVKRRSDLNFLG